LAASAFNPYGVAILAYPFKTVSLPVLQAHILEWQPPDFRHPQIVPFLVMLLALIAALGVSRRPASSAEIITSAGWTALALLAVRNVPVFALTAAPVISLHAAESLEHVRRTDAPASDAPEHRRLNAALGAVLAVAFLVWLGVQLSPARNRDHLAAQVPLKAMSALRQVAPTAQLLNDYNWGGYVLWDLYPSLPSFVDGRTDVFSSEVLDDYLRLWTAAPGWETLVERYDIGVVLLPPQAPLLASLRQAGWAETFRDDQAVVMIRPGSR
jgi:hypothetical protein